ncbi:MAG: ACT domain-containing protein [Phycisphaerales bacterium]|nr:ACT domain-containing protein [Phycisphaerales bacterium]
MASSRSRAITERGSASCSPRPGIRFGSSMVDAPRLDLEWLPGEYAICRLPAETPTPVWADTAGAFTSLTRTADECSIIAPAEHVPADTRAERGWAAVRVVGPLSFDMVGVLARVSGALAAAGVPLCAVSTYDTDVFLFKADYASRVVSALAAVASLPPRSSSAI